MHQRILNSIWNTYRLCLKCGKWEFLSLGCDCMPGHSSNSVPKYAMSSTALWLPLAKNTDHGCRRDHSTFGDTKTSGHTAVHFFPTAWIEPCSPGPEADVDSWWMTGQFPSLALFGIIYVPLCYVAGKRLSSSTFTAVQAAAPWATQLPREQTALLPYPFSTCLLTTEPTGQLKELGDHWFPWSFCCIAMSYK